MYRNKKQLTTMTLLTILIVGVFAGFIRNANAAEMTAQQKGLTLMHDAVGLDLTKYAVTTEENSQYPTSLGTVLQESMVYNLTSANSKIRAYCTFANGNLQGIYILENQGTPSLTKSTSSKNVAKMAQDFLSNYQTISAKQIFGELSSTLSNLDVSKNLTKTFGDKVLEVNVSRYSTYFKWYYTSNGATAQYSKVVALGFENGFLSSFIDNWNLYSIGSTSVNLSKEEAITIALDTARKHSWTMQLDADTLDVKNFNAERSVSWTSLDFDSSLEADNTRGDVLELYPVWSVGIVLNKVYGELYGIEVDIWADTKEIRSVNEEYSQLAGPWYENITKANTSIAFVNGMELNFMVGLMLSATTVGIIGVFATVFVKKPRTLSRLKPRFLKISRILLVFLLISVVFLSLAETVNATTRAGNVWGSRSTGAPNSPESYSWRKEDAEIDKQDDVSDYITSQCFTAANGYTDYNNWAVNKNSILSQAGYLSNNFDYVAIVDWDHGVGGYPGRAPGYPSVGYYDMHYMFEDDWGTVVGPPPTPPATAPSDWSHGVYDIDIYNAFPPAKVHFAFIDACESADLYRLGQGSHPNNSLPVGLPFAFTHRQVSFITDGTDMSSDGYGSPDPFPQCYIGFPDGSASLSQRVYYNQQYDRGPYWYTWVEDFFYLALNFDISVKDALDVASDNAWQCDTFDNSPLSPWEGFNALWRMYVWNPTAQEFQWIDYTGPHSDLAVYGNSNIHLKNFQPSDYVTDTSYITGPLTGSSGTSYSFSTYALDSHGHRIRYLFDWGDGSPQTLTGYAANNQPVSTSHTWSTGGIYTIRAKAQCENGEWSDYWSIPININIDNQPVYRSLMVAAFDNQYYYDVHPNVYVDGNWVGTAPLGVPVLVGYHSVWLDTSAYCEDLGYDEYLIGFSDGLGNGDYRYVSSDYWLDAAYA